jgi:hypothetical protein
MGIVFVCSAAFLCLLLLAAILYVRTVRSAAQSLYERYNRYARQVFSEHFVLQPDRVRPEYRTLHPWKALKLIRIAVEPCRSDRFRRIGIVDATLGFAGKMFTLCIQPDYGYNLPVFDLEVIIMGSRRIFVIEFIDAAGVSDDYKDLCYGRMRALKLRSPKLQELPVTRWYRDVVPDFSIHARAHSDQDEELFTLFQHYLDAYVDMAKHAPPASQEVRAQLRRGMVWYTDTLIEKGGPATDVFKMLLGTQGMKEYVRTVMFSID